MPTHHPALSATATAPSPGFAGRVIDWQRHAGRHQLPWQDTRDPYRIWVSEIMLQQTQVTTVIPYFLRFMRRFPTVADLAAAEEADVLALWGGLGYYARGRNLHRAARIIRDLHDGLFPRTLEAVMALPGVGRSTAGAICVFAFGHRHPILDGNVKRVLTRCFGIQGFPGEREVEAQLWSLSHALLPVSEVEAYTQGLMDLGAGVCARTRPRCDQCPLREDCIARRDELVAKLPTPRPRKILPRRRTTVLMLWNGSGVLLERRPSAGIWGGLWSFPEADDAAAAQQALCLRHGVRAVRCTQLAEVKHSFTHYHLSIDPVLVETVAAAPVMNDAAFDAGNVRWMTLTEARAAGLPAPVRALLDRLETARSAATPVPGAGSGGSL